ncbi:NlpC/P60 family protein [Sporomusa carbonis]|uniref:C40 family peptidase n=1 Tax=Sporomusa carbonis TaxID=3076075 RepID=UPI003C7E2058
MSLVFYLPAGQVEAADVLRQGDTGQEVVFLQERLRQLQYNVFVDGVFGPGTEAAVMEFQLDNGIASDGIVGAGTWEALRTAGPKTSRGRNNGLLIESIIQTAKRYQGVPYLWGGTTPNGFDCSGFTQYVFGLNGIRLPRTADLQYELGVPVRYDQLQPGDLVYFSTYEPGPSHNGIYIGDGKFISATSSRGVTIANMTSSYWGPRYIGAKRILR